MISQTDCHDLVAHVAVATGAAGLGLGVLLTLCAGWLWLRVGGSPLQFPGRWSRDDLG